ncbi:hypothetical protein FAM09_17240 [Niastella caeni]|uniref:Uncharacterized protein n=1 Tax=Niastella caeni TaxID=2569763 RepID=A0A4S8HWI8_9BACT|nr:hypothetical protein [Niastella caeni]THU38414.1 hypothetical protein FAM09_17240 [Niastella caeni]
MKFLISFSILGIITISTKAQSLEEKLADSACKYIDSINLAKIITPQDKKTAITFIFAKAVAENNQAINSDKRFAGLKSYEQGKKLGQLMAQNIFPTMRTRCPKFQKLAN